jgi:hypothetical protein
MKKALLIAAAVMFVASSLFAQELPPIGYIGVFADATHNTNPAANYVCPGPYGSFGAWIWCLPSENGLQAAEFAVSFPPVILVSASVKNPLIAVELGALATGISVALAEGSCQTDWVWLYQLTCVLLSPTPVSVKVDIIPHPGTLPLPAYQFASCELGYPIEPCIYLTPLYICMEPSPLGVQQTNWGAIKSLF